jgi:hypothetical protein
MSRSSFDVKEREEQRRNVVMIGRTTRGTKISENGNVSNHHEQQ